MANQDRRPPPQPAEDMFGRPTDVRHDKDEDQPSREQQGSQQLPQSESGARKDPEEEFHKQCDAFHKYCEHEAQEEIAYGGVGAIPDGDGVRSDLGTNPLPDVYWSAYPDKRPSGR
jgi:hypothetical protein